MHLKGKVALVTGSAKGIGKAIILDLASKGCNVIINYLTSEQEAYELKKELENKYHVEVLVIKADISNELDVKEMITKIIDRFNKIDILVNNAAIEINSELKNKTKDSFIKVLNTNVVGTFLVSKYVGEYMMKEKYGKIINITSNNAINKYDPVTLEYDASKAAIISLTHNFSKAFSPFINVNAIAPGWVKTESIEKIDLELDGNFIKEESKKILKKRFAEPNEIASLVSFLVSDDAEYINNEVIKIDGGTIDD